MRAGAIAATHITKGDLAMSGLLVAVVSFRKWLRLRAERKAMWWATDQLSRLPDDVLSDIGVSRDEITALLEQAPFRGHEDILQCSDMTAQNMPADLRFLGPRHDT
ncbi:DUF1127 domain-containing protein [Allomesorhizobium camelthorni]|uniref:DUF1127 domain-containing protein n=1 Tax=Allomesorhizobium camelthorni TaxID=475069 RepID=A0A6G4WHU2_9HYPH|nr:DUF1127 domain-containing protein [Mesorhizobium camelthorni]NGO54331.1 DUF1127 domain-containing protein [Mesorhizobium camelthorni]